MWGTVETEELIRQESEEAKTAGPKNVEASLAVEIAAELGEGSIWDRRCKKLLWVDIYRSRLFRFEPKSKKNEEYDLSQHSVNVTSVVPLSEDVDADGDAVGLTLREGFAVYNFKTQALTRLGGDPGVGQFERFNDGKVDPKGRYWAGTITRDEHFAPCRGAKLYRRDLDGSVVPVLTDLSISNGLVWTSDAKIMYYIDTPTGQVDVLSYDADTGEVTNRQPCITGFDFEKTGFPDGCTLDKDGMLWVARFNGGCAGRYDPMTGNLLAEVRVPAAAGKQVTSVAFGGDSLEDLYLTTAREGFDDEQKKAQPLAGSLFVVPKASLQQLGAVEGQPQHHLRWSPGAENWCTVQ